LGFLKISGKGLTLSQFAKQLLAYFIDGSDMSMTSFDRRKQDALFRRGSDHSNHGHDFMKAMGRLVRAIRRFYGDVPIIVATDGGFWDDQNFRFFEERLGIGYICGGRQYDELKTYYRL